VEAGWCLRAALSRHSSRWTFLSASIFSRASVPAACARARLHNRLPTPSPRHRLRHGLALTLAALAGGASYAVEPAALSVVTVIGRAGDDGLGLDQPSTTGSRTGLTARELPASLEAVRGDQVQERGDYAVRDAISRTAGLTDIASPGDGGLSFSVRGFTGTNSVGIAEDGLRLAVAAGTQTYPSDTWGYERLEVLRGPASVVFGSGTVGATINAIRKAPQRQQAFDGLIAAGDHGSTRLGIGATGPVNDVVSYRIDAYGLTTDGVRALGKASGGKLMTTLRVDPNPALRFELMADYSQQSPERYFGAPFVDGRIDSSLRKENYNAADSLVRYEDERLRGRVNWELSPALTLSDEVFFLHAHRHWRNIEEYTYNSTTQLVDRDSYLEILHDQSQRGNRAELAWKAGGHQAVAGWEAASIYFRHSNNSPYSGASTVTLNDPVSGNWTSPDPTLPKFKTDTTMQAVYAEDAWRAAERLLLLGGLRYDSTSVTRTPLVASQVGFDKTLAGTSARLGATWEVDARTSAYVQFSTGHDPVTSLVTLNFGNRDFRLTTGRQVEIGLKQTLPGGLGDWTAALYRIRKDDIITQSPADPTLSVQGGSQHSQGLELGASLTPFSHWRFEGNLALLQARYDDLREDDGSAGGVSRAGKRPTDVPQQVANLWAHYRTGDWQASAGARYVGKRYADTANTLALPAYTVFDASLGWELSRTATLRAVARNIADKVYAISTYDTQALFGEPRRGELVAELKF
jgi:iron complex outermembrane receptor protein